MGSGQQNEANEVACEEHVGSESQYSREPRGNNRISETKEFSRNIFKNSIDIKIHDIDGEKKDLTDDTCPYEMTTFCKTFQNFSKLFKTFQSFSKL